MSRIIIEVSKSNYFIFWATHSCVWINKTESIPLEWVEWARQSCRGLLFEHRQFFYSWHTGRGTMCMWYINQSAGTSTRTTKRRWSNLYRVSRSARPRHRPRYTSAQVCFVIAHSYPSFGYDPICGRVYLPPWTRILIFCFDFFGTITKLCSTKQNGQIVVVILDGLSPKIKI